MKFAKELEQDLVPEWRAKYLDYKEGKKKIKAITRAVRNAHKSPHTPRPKPTWLPSGTSIKTSPRNPPSALGQRNTVQGAPASEPAIPQPAILHNSASSPVAIPTQSPELQPLTGATSNNRQYERNGKTYTRYGSIIGSPPSPIGSQPPSQMLLPDPAMDPASIPETIDEEPSTRPSIRHAHSTPATISSGSAYQVGRTKHPPHRHPRLIGRHAKAQHLHASNTARAKAAANKARPLTKRLFSHDRTKLAAVSPDIPLDAVRAIDARQDEFWDFLDRQYDKVEEFYCMKEDEATLRLKELRTQLHVMRDERLHELWEEDLAHERRKSRLKSNASHAAEQSAEDAKLEHHSLLPHMPDFKSGLDALQHPLDAAKRVTFGHGKKSFKIDGTPTEDPLHHLEDGHRDYARRPVNHDVPYKAAKTKLKRALQELYRGLELLKSYALLNRTAFRKINKKYDKAVHARPPMRYMTEKVNNAWFVQSDVLDGHIVTIEDLYARYFENGSHKLAVGKLRKRGSHNGHYSGSVFRNGIFTAIGAVFGIEAVVYGANLLLTQDPINAVKTSYLLQIYGGYFLMLLLFLLFCLDCRMFEANRINYVFVFEFDTHHNLDWRQLSEFPSMLLCLLGFIMWLNFTRVGGDTMYIYYPAILLAATGLLIFLPAPVLYHRSRQWFVYSTWRLFLAGIYPVEFRDFFLGDMFCSLTYSLGNIELFFCLFAKNWVNPDQCNSTHSRLLGFFSALPGIWRALQCVRRYRATRNVFPHLVNCGKYTFTICYAMTLSIFRINQNDTTRAIFITFASINSIYCSIWDLFMDFSLMDPDADYWLLRMTLAYKWKWIYYCAIVLDPILRFNWIFYPIYLQDVQHSSLVSFMVGLSEVLRRAMWTLLRVENEHCTNVGRFRASRDVPLPYDLATPSTTSQSSPEQQRKSQPPTPQGGASPHATGTDIERVDTRESLRSSLRRRGRPAGAAAGPSPSIGMRVGQLLRTAHAQDFERKRKPGLVYDEDDEDDDDDDDEDGLTHDASSDEEEDHAQSAGRSTRSQPRDLLSERDVADAEILLDRARSRRS